VARILTHLKVRRSPGGSAYRARLTWFETTVGKIGYDNASTETSTLTEVATWADGLLAL
jgi:hypothetical protein